MVTSERFGGASGILAVAVLGGQFALLAPSKADPARADFATALVAERWRYELVTLLRIVGAFALVFFTAGFAGRLRRAGRAHSPSASLVFSAGIVWAAVWLVSAFLNSAAILFATRYADPQGARVAGALAAEALYVLTPGITILLLVATSALLLRDRSFPRPFAYGTLFATALRVVLALVDWYGSGAFSAGLMDVALLWVVIAGGQLMRTRAVAA